MSKPLQETREAENKEQAARKEQENFRKRQATRDLEDKEQAARKELVNSAEAANRWKQTREIENKERTARKEFENARTSKPLERD